MWKQEQVTINLLNPKTLKILCAYLQIIYPQLLCLLFLLLFLLVPASGPFVLSRGGSPGPPASEPRLWLRIHLLKDDVTPIQAVVLCQYCSFPGMTLMPAGFLPSMCKAYCSSMNNIILRNRRSLFSLLNLAGDKLTCVSLFTVLAYSCLFWGTNLFSTDY